MRYFCILILLLGLTQWAFADNSWDFTADSVRYEKQLQTTIAEGDVVLEQAVEGGNRRLEADKVIYNRKEDMVTAIGNVKMWDEKGTYYEFNYAEISGDFKHAAIEELSLQLQNYGRLKADSAKRTEHLSVFDNPSYSACNFCEEDPDGPLLWELKASKVIHDENKKLLKYYNTRLYLGGVPVFYMPYFYYPDPTVKRQTGFLLPKFGSDRNIGTYFSLPYFITLGNSADLTINPILTTEGGQLLAGRFRKRWENSQLDGEISFTEASETRGDVTASRFDRHADRWHVDIEGKTQINDFWNAGFHINRASDRNYLRRYPFWGEPGNFLQSRIYAERVDGRDYINATAYSFQDLRLQDRQASPRIFPNIDAYFYGDRDSRGGLWELYGNFRLHDVENLVRDRRIYGRASYQLPYYHDSGLVVTTNLNLYGKVQSSDFETARNSFGNLARDDESANLLPQVGFRLSVPYSRHKDGATRIIEPLAVVYVAPEGENTRNINNSDADIFALDSHNILNAHRLNGLDRFDGGQRIAYGINLQHYEKGFDLKGFIGQSYEFTEDEVLAEELHINKGASDIIVAAETNIDLGQDWGALDWDNQLQLDNEKTSLNRYFSQVSLGDDDLRWHGNYLYTRRRGIIENQEQLSFTVDKKLSKYWRGELFATVDWGDKDPTSTSRTRRYGSRFTYDDECFTLHVSASRDFTSNPDIESGYSVGVTFSLKTLGNFGSGADEPARSVSGYCWI